MKWREPSKRIPGLTTGVEAAQANIEQKEQRRSLRRMFLFGHLAPRPLRVEETFVLADQSANWPHVTGWQEWKRLTWRIVLWGIPVSLWRRGAQPLWLSHPWVRNPPFPNNGSDLARPKDASEFSTSGGHGG
jgi:hypothetical protein